MACCPSRFRSSSSWLRPSWVIAVVLPVPAAPVMIRPRRALMACRVWLRDFLKTEVAALLKPALSAAQRPVRLVGTGGTATILARVQGKLNDFDREKIEATALTVENIRQMVESQWQMTLGERQNIPGLPADRADVILTGMAIYEGIMEQFGFKDMAVSTRGLRYWALLHP